MASKLEVRISSSAERQFRKLASDSQRRIGQAVQALATDPLPRGSRKLTGYDDVFRIRVGHYRILYSVSSTMLIIVVLKIGHRRDVYR